MTAVICASFDSPASRSGAPSAASTSSRRRRQAAALVLAAGAALAGCAVPTAPPAALATAAPTGAAVAASTASTASTAAAATPRIAVISAFDAELALLRSRTVNARTQRINGVDFTTGELEGKPVVLLLSGISMTNAAMQTQLVLDRFAISQVVFSGIAGGVDPALHIGDVVVAQRWGSYLEAVFPREVSPGTFKVPPYMADTLPPFGFIFPRPVTVRSQGSPEPEKKFWFDVDADMLAQARQLSSVKLDACNAAGQCLSSPPKLVFGGNGVSGQAFVDNAAFRRWTFDTFQANVLDMETSAVAQVAYANGKPFIAFRSLSDLAGGGEAENEMGVFFRIAADNSAKVVMAFLKAWKPS